MTVVRNQLCFGGSLEAKLVPLSLSLVVLTGRAWLGGRFLELAFVEFVNRRLVDSRIQ